MPTPEQTPEIVLPTDWEYLRRIHNPGEVLWSIFLPGENPSDVLLKATAQEKLPSSPNGLVNFGIPRVDGNTFLAKEYEPVRVGKMPQTEIGQEGLRRLHRLIAEQQGNAPKQG